MRIDLTTFLVHDLDLAIAFFVEALGFDLAEDTVLDPGSTASGAEPKRWVVVRPPGGGSGLLLAQALGPEQQAAIGAQAGGRVGWFLRVDDFDAQHRRMLAAGVEFLEDPRHEEYGTVAVFRDVAGGTWDLIGPQARRA